jgi:hypothetical protein
MGTIAAGYDNFGTPWLEVVSGGQIDYNVIQQSIGQGYQYGVNGLYMKADTVSQLLQSVTLEKNNRRGIFEQKIFVPTIDPYQLVAALNADVVDEGQHESLTFNGLQNFVVPIEAGENVFFVFSLQEQGTSNIMPKPSNFEMLEYFDYLADFPDRDAGSFTQRDILVQLRVVNNSADLGVPFIGKVSLLGGAPDTYNQSLNADGLWQWATFNTEPFNVSAINLQYKKAGAPTFSSITLNGSLTSAQSWANALNAQTGLGLFWVSYNVFNQPILLTTNDTLDFGTLTYTGTL